MLKLNFLKFGLRENTTSHSDLRKAFFAAFVFHALFFLLFKVVSPVAKEIQSTLPFTKVDIEIPQNVGSGHDLAKVSHFFQAAEMPSINYEVIEPKNIVIFEQSLEEPDFSFYEKIPYVTPFQDVYD